MDVSILSLVLAIFLPPSRSLMQEKLSMMAMIIIIITNRVLVRSKQLVRSPVRSSAANFVRSFVLLPQRAANARFKKRANKSFTERTTEWTNYLKRTTLTQETSHDGAARARPRRPTDCLYSAQLASNSRRRRQWHWRRQFMSSRHNHGSTTMHNRAHTRLCWAWGTWHTHKLAMPLRWPVESLTSLARGVRRTNRLTLIGLHCAFIRPSLSLSVSFSPSFSFPFPLARAAVLVIMFCSTWLFSDGQLANTQWHQTARSFLVDSRTSLGSAPNFELPISFRRLQGS